jgi:hypothetical protein
MKTWLAAMAAVSWLSGVAAADAGPPGATFTPPGGGPSTVTPIAPVVPAASVDPTQPGLDAIAAAPGTDRGVLFENALTVPQGQAEIDVRGTIAVGVLDLRFGATPTTELSLEAGLAAGLPELAVGIKQVIVNGRRFRLALDGSLRQLYVQEEVAQSAACCGGQPDPTGFIQSSSAQVGAIGVVATGCIDGGCMLRVSAGSQLWVAFGDGGGAVEVAWADVELGPPKLRLVTEGILGFNFASGNAPVQVVALGLRGGWRKFALEGGAVVVTNDDGTGNTVTLPYLGVTGRL